MISEGHSEAWFYPLGMVADEANLITERQHARIASDAALIQQAIASVLSKEGRKEFTKTLKKLTVKTEPIRPITDEEE